MIEPKKETEIENKPKMINAYIIDEPMFEEIKNIIGGAPSKIAGSLYHLLKNSKPRQIALVNGKNNKEDGGR